MLRLLARWLRGSVLEDFGSFHYVKPFSLQLNIDQIDLSLSSKIMKDPLKHTENILFKKMLDLCFAVLLRLKEKNPDYSPFLHLKFCFRYLFLN